MLMEDGPEGQQRVLVVRDGEGGPAQPWGSAPHEAEKGKKSWKRGKCQVLRVPDLVRVFSHLLLDLYGFRAGLGLSQIPTKDCVDWAEPGF